MQVPAIINQINSEWFARNEREQNSKYDSYYYSIIAIIQELDLYRWKVVTKY
jgi:hypothetical protein